MDLREERGERGGGGGVREERGERGGGERERGGRGRGRRGSCNVGPVFQQTVYTRVTDLSEVD